MSKPVLVIGAGPVGLTMAIELARYGVPVRIIDKLPTRTTQSRALAIWPRRGNLTEGLCIGLDYEKVCFAQKNFS
ncbi:hypothetical protein NBRC3299_1997 [Acetobacter pasteurianus NBRC 3299]|nr:hypothetical protein NBRC3299_1997 [Acetobacter pasteurianus NBRC 3299]